MFKKLLILPFITVVFILAGCEDKKTPMLQLKAQ